MRGSSAPTEHGTNTRPASTAGTAIRSNTAAGSRFHHDVGARGQFLPGSTISGGALEPGQVGRARSRSRALTATSLQPGDAAAAPTPGRAPAPPRGRPRPGHRSRPSGHRRRPVRTGNNDRDGASDRDSNPRHPRPQPGALPTELRPPPGAGALRRTRPARQRAARGAKWPASRVDRRIQHLGPLAEGETGIVVRRVGPRRTRSPEWRSPRRAR